MGILLLTRQCGASSGLRQMEAVHRYPARGLTCAPAHSWPVARLPLPQPRHKSQLGLWTDVLLGLSRLIVERSMWRSCEAAAQDPIVVKVRGCCWTWMSFLVQSTIFEALFIYVLTGFSAPARWEPSLRRRANRAPPRRVGLTVTLPLLPPAGNEPISS